ncbi:MAG: peptidoglycan-binding protein [Bryobacteraceae bacterium]|nr:peptidoglycan-binding protein [Bryobacteraceae bacterium]
MALKLLRFIVLALAMSLALLPQTAKKSTPKTPAAKSAPKKSTPPKAAAKKPTAKKTTARRTPARRTAPARQTVPEKDRIREIQQALTERGYAVEPTGSWGPDSIAALKRFQEDHEINNLSGRGKLDSLTLIALGLGPKHGPNASPPPEPPATPENPDLPAAPIPNQEGQRP